MSDNKQEQAATLLAKYKSADAEVVRIKQMLEEASKLRSDVVKEIHDNLGKGPFTYKGDFLGKIVARGQTYFFRSPKEDNVIKVD